MKKKKTKVALLIGIVAMIIIGATVAWNIVFDYSKILKANWGFSIPSESRYSEIYSKDSGMSFHGDGIRYHIFSYKKEEAINEMVMWQSTEQSTVFCGSYSEAATERLDEIDVPLEKRPNYTECCYWYQTQNDHSEIIIFLDKGQKKLYFVELFL